MSFVIIGGGTAGWLSALALSHYSKAAGREDTITIIEPNDLPTIGVGEATTDSFIPFLLSLGIDVKELIKETGSSFKQTILLKDWLEIGKNYYHPFYEKSLPLSFLLDAQGSQTRMEDIFLNVILAKRKKSPYRLDYRAACGLHFDNFLLAKYLKKITFDRGIKLVNKKVEDFVQGPDGKILAVKTEENLISGDYFLDCSGFSSILLGKKLKTPFHDFSPYLLNNKAFALQIPYESPNRIIEPYTTAHALSAGWCWRIPIRERTGSGYVYSDQHVSSEAAEKEFREKFKISENISGRDISIRVGHYENIFVSNCIGVGLSSGFIEPLESTGILFITKVLEKFGDYLQGKCTTENVNSYMRDYYVSTRDFLFLHYKLSKREDSQYWRDVRSLDYPESLQSKRELFKQIKLGSNSDTLVSQLKKECFPWDPKAYLFILNGLDYFSRSNQMHPYEGVLKKFILELEEEAGTYKDNTEFIDDLNSVVN